MTHPTVEQNKAHHDDPFWARLKGGIYLHSTGHTITKNVMTGRWIGSSPDGTPAVRTIILDDDRRVDVPVNEHSLTWAKYTMRDVMEQAAATSTEAAA